MRNDGSERLYVVEILGQGVKVGVTANPEDRLATHRRDAEAYGRVVGRVWMSEPHEEARVNERHLKKLAGSRQRREYLPLSYDYVLRHARQLPQTLTLGGLTPIEYFLLKLAT